MFRSPSDEASTALTSRLAIGHVKGTNSREDNAPIKRPQFAEGKKYSLNEKCMKNMILTP